MQIHPSVTLRYCVRTSEHKRMRSLPSGSPLSPVFRCQEWLLGVNHVQVKFECKEVHTCENSRAVHMSPHNYGTILDSEKSSINANRKWTMGFLVSHQPRSCVTPNFFKIEFRYPNMSFFAEISTKNHRKSAVEFYCLKTFSGKVVARSTTYQTVSTSWQGMTAFPLNLGLNAPIPNRKDARFAFHTRRAVQSAIADLLALYTAIS